MQHRNQPDDEFAKSVHLAANESMANPGMVIAALVLTGFAFLH